MFTRGYSVFNVAQVNGYAAPALPVLPDAERIGYAEAFFTAIGTLAHEATHLTGHSTRCARDLQGRFGDEAYAAEELIAELGAAFVCADLALTPEPRPDHAAYAA